MQHHAHVCTLRSKKENNANTPKNKTTLLNIRAHHSYAATWLAHKAAWNKREASERNELVISTRQDCDTVTHDRQDKHEGNK
jgi:hypothetical protein